MDTLTLQYSKNKLLELLNQFIRDDQGFIHNLMSQTHEKYYRVKRFRQLINTTPFTQTELAEIITLTWAMSRWRNKAKKAKDIIDQNGLTKIHYYLRLLGNSTISAEKRYSNFIQNINGLGPAFVTEILCHLEPNKAGIWNTRSRSFIRFIDANIPTSSSLRPEQYTIFNRLLTQISKDIAVYMKLQYPINLLELNYIIWRLYEYIPHNTQNSKRTTNPLRSPQNYRTHQYNDPRDKIAQIGQWLGFDTEIEKQISNGLRVDAVWQARIANLGTVKYIFEVQHRGSIDSLLINLLKAVRDPSVQKLVIVTDKEQITKIQNRLTDMPESLKNLIVFWEDSKVLEAFEHLENFIDIISELNLVQ